MEKDNRPMLKQMRKILFENGIKYGIHENESGLYVFTYGIIIQERIAMFKKLFNGHKVKIYKSKPEEITIEILNE
jgi:hypothetical protein